MMDHTPPATDAPPTTDLLLTRRRVTALIEELVAMTGHQAKFERSRLIKQAASLGDRATVQKILLKEFQKSHDINTLQLIAEMLLQVGELTTLRDPLWDIIKSADCTDEAKDCANLILRHLGDESHPEDYIAYLSDPNNLVQRETVRMLKLATDNPEALVDFLDFIVTLEAEEQTDLLDTILSDDPETAFSVSALLTAVADYYPEGPIADYCLKALSRYPTAHVGKWLQKAAVPLSNRSQLLKRYTRQLTRQLQLAGLVTRDAQAAVPSQNGVPMFSLINAQHHHHAIVQASAPYVCYITLPDGQGDQALVFSRQYPNGDQALISVAFNTEEGIIDCFGVQQLEAEEVDTILERFQPANQRFPITPQLACALLDEAETTSRQQLRPIPYEYSCWRLLFEDVDPAYPTLLPEHPETRDPTWREETLRLFARHQFDVQHWAASIQDPPERLARSWAIEWPQTLARMIRRVGEDEEHTDSLIRFLNYQWHLLSERLASDGIWLRKMEHILRTLLLVIQDVMGQTDLDQARLLTIYDLFTLTYRTLAAGQMTAAQLREERTLRWVLHKHLVDRLLDTLESLVNPVPTPPGGLDAASATPVGLALTPQQISWLEQQLLSTLTVWEYPLSYPTLSLVLDDSATLSREDLKKRFQLLHAPAVEADALDAPPVPSAAPPSGEELPT